MSLKTGFLVSIAVLTAFVPVLSFAQFTVSGKVISKDNGTPLPDAAVVLDSSFLSTITGPGGGFRFEKVAKGPHSLTVKYLGYKTFVMKFDLSSDTNLTVALSGDIFMNEEFIVRSTRIRHKTPGTYTNITQRELERTNTGQDLPYLISLTPSVVTTSDAGAGVGYTSIRIRGTDLTGINVTMNGVPVNDPESHQVYFVDLPDLASSINNIQIQRGVGTSSNGSAAFGASVNIKTSTLNPEAYGEINSSAGSFNTFKNTLKFGSGLIDGKWAFDGRLSSISSGGYIERGWSKLRSFYVSGGYFGKKTVLKAIVTSGFEKTYQAWYGTPEDSLATNRRYNPSGVMYDENGDIAGYYDNQTDNYNQTHYQLHLVQSTGEKSNITVSAFLTKGKGYYESYKNNKKFSSYGLENVIIGGDTITRTNLIQQKWLDNDFYGINAAYNYETSLIEITFGGGWNRYQGDHSGYIVWAQYASNGFIDKPWYENTGDKTDYNFFGKANWHLNETFSLYGDLQYRGIVYKINGIDDDLRDITQTHTFGFINPKAGVYVTPGGGNEIYASFAVANREPDRAAYKDADPGTTVKPERLYDYELGYKYKREKLTVQTNLYYMDYKDQLVLTGKINNVGTPVKVNVPESYRAGVEIAAGVRVSKSLLWNVNATFSRNRIKNFTGYIDNWDYWDDPDNQPLQFEEKFGETDISFSPSIIAGSSLQWNVFRSFGLTLISKYTSRQYIDNTSNSARSLDPYFVNNLLLTYSVETKIIKRIDFKLSLNNILNEKYETNAWVYRYVYGGKEAEMNGYFPQAGFNFMAGVGLRF